MGIPVKPKAGKDTYSKNPGSAGGGDSKGYERGARGIDGRNGEGFDREHNNNAMIEATYGRGDDGTAGTSKKGLGDPWGGSK